MVNNFGRPIANTELLQKLFFSITTDEDSKGPLVGSFCGDNGTGAGRSFASALWLVDHAPILLRTLRTINNCGLDPLEDISDIVQALAQSLAVPASDRLEITTRLMLDLGRSLDGNGDWVERASERLSWSVDKTSKKTTGTGFENYVLPWALQVEKMNSSIPPLTERIASLKDTIPRNLRGRTISELELNNWAYYLLLVGRWRSATPMAAIATEMSREIRNVDTLGWAFWFEGESEHSLRLLDEALGKMTEGEDLEGWAEIQYHKIQVLADIGRTESALEGYQLLQDRAPSSPWTKRSSCLAPLFTRPLSGKSPRVDNPNRSYEFDVALSYAGESREHARELAMELQRRNIKVFFDEWEKDWLWGEDLSEVLVDLYENRTRHCILLLSQSYAAKDWPRLERSAVQRRVQRTRSDYVLPVSIERSVEIPEVFETTAFLDWASEGSDGIAAAVERKLARG